MLNTTSNLEDSIYGNKVAIDHVQQYLRRNCLEIVGIPLVREDNPIGTRKRKNELPTHLQVMREMDTAVEALPLFVNALFSFSIHSSSEEGTGYSFFL